MARTIWLLVVVLLAAGLSGCVSDRDAGPEPTSMATPSTGSIPTLPSLAQLPPTSTPQPTPTPLPTPTPITERTASTQIDSPLAIPRDDLETLGLVPQETGVNIFYELALAHYEGEGLFDNYWELPEDAAGRIGYVSDFRYAFPSVMQTDAFLFNASYGLIQSAAQDGNEVTEYYAYLGDISFVAGFMKPGQAVYAAQFATETTAAIVIVAGDDTLSVEDAIEIFSLAASQLGVANPGDSTPVAGSVAPGMVTGEWMARQRDVQVNPDGTGHVRVNSGCCNGVVYYVTIDDPVSPTTATVVGRSFIGNIDHTNAAPVGDVIGLEIQVDGEYDVLVVTLPESERNFVRELTLCRGGFDPPCAT